MTKRLMTIGEPMVVFSSQDADAPLAEATNYKTALAGAELNVAVGVTRLGLPVDYVAAVGDNPFGEFIVTELDKQGVNTSKITRDAEHPTGIYFKQRVSTGDPKTYYLRKGSAAANMAYPDVNLDEYDFLHLTGIYAAISDNAHQVEAQLMKNALAQNPDLTITFDPNLRPALWGSEAKMVQSLNELAKFAHIVLPGVGEGLTLCGTEKPSEIAEFYLGQSEVTHTVIVKVGAEGAYYQTRKGPDGEPLAGFVDGFKVGQVVDTVGAGDGFSAGLISALMDGHDLGDAVKRACAIGALAVTKAGDCEGYPTRAELETFISNR